MNSYFWYFFIGITLGILVMAGVAIYLVYRFSFIDILRFLNQPKVNEAIHTISRISWRDYLEAHLQAETGKSLERPFGSTNHQFSLAKLQFNPTYLSKPVLSYDTEIDTTVTIGPLAKKPLKLGIPVMIGGMSYGNALSFKAQIALAKGSTRAATAINSGNGPFLDKVRQDCSSYILQYPRAFWSKTESVLQQVDMIEIALGHGAWNSAPVRIKGSKITPDVANAMNVIPGLDQVIDSRLTGITNTKELTALVRDLKKVTGGVPVGIKIGATHYLEQELDILIPSGIDFFTFDGAEGGTHGAPNILADDLGLPTFPALGRVTRYWQDHHLRGKVSLIVGGGLVNPGDFLKCLALGADGIIIGTIAMLTIVHTQVTKVIPWEPPTALIFHGGNSAEKYQPETGALHFFHYLNSCILEMKELARTLGKNDLKKLSRNDLVALDPLYAKIAGVDYYTSPPSSQNRYQ